MGSKRLLFLAAVLLNAAAIAIGFYFYSDQLAATDIPFLIFVPDCPLYVFLSLLIILGIIRNESFSFIVSCGMVKYGMWTVFALLFHWDFYSTPLFLWTSAVFIIGHIGMAAEGLAILPKKQLGAAALLFAAGWLLLNDVSDYLWGTVPPLPPGGIETVRALTFASSILLPPALFFYGKKIRGLPGIRQLRALLFG